MKLRLRSSFGAAQVGRWHAYATEATKAARVRYSTGFIAGPSNAIAEMRALAADGRGNAKPMWHVVASFAPDEPVTLDGYEALMSELYASLGLGDCLTIDAAHGDALCRHGHSLVLRRDLRSGKLLLPEARIGKQLHDFAVSHSPRDQHREERPLSGRMRDAETYNGRVSFARFLREQLGGVTTWGDHDARLSMLQVGLEEAVHGKTRGFVYRDLTGKDVVRLSAVLDRPMRERLGPRPPFTPDLTLPQLAGYAQRPIETMLAPGIDEATLAQWQDRRDPARLGVFALAGRTNPGVVESSRDGSAGRGLGGLVRPRASAQTVNRIAPGSRTNATSSRHEDVNMSTTPQEERTAENGVAPIFNRLGPDGTSVRNVIGAGTTTSADSATPLSPEEVADKALIERIQRSYFTMQDEELKQNPLLQQISTKYAFEQEAYARAIADIESAEVNEGISPLTSTIAEFTALQTLAAAQEQAQLGYAVALDDRSLRSIPSFDAFVSDHAHLNDVERARALDLLRSGKFPTVESIVKFDYDQTLATALQTHAAYDGEQQTVSFIDNATDRARCVFQADGLILDARPAQQDIDLALKVAAQRYNNVIDISGTKEFVAAALARAVELDIQVSTPGLQAEYARLVTERDNAKWTNELGQDVVKPIDVSFSKQTDTVLKKFGDVSPNVKPEDRLETMQTRERDILNALVRVNPLASAQSLGSPEINVGSLSSYDISKPGPVVDGSLLGVIDTLYNGKLGVVDAGVERDGSGALLHTIYVDPIEISDGRDPQFLDDITMVSDGQSALGFEKGMAPQSLPNIHAAGMTR